MWPNRSSAPPSLSIAKDLVARGHRLEAIDVLTAANRQARHPAIERRLLDLRLEGFAVPPAASALPFEDPALESAPLPGPSGLPEIRACDLTVERLRAAMRAHGALIVRGLVGEAKAGSLADAIGRLFEARETERPSLLRRSHTGARLRRWNRQTGAFLVADSAAMTFDVLEAFEEAGLRPLVTAYFGERPALLARKWTLRKIPPDAPMGDWHQDGAFLGRDIRSLNLWLSLSHCGDDAPGLDIVGQRLDRIVETGTDGAFFDWSVGHGMAERCAQGRIVRPIFEAGDAVFFDHMNLHRTAVEPGMRNVRYAIESWFLAPSSYGAMIGSGKKTWLGRAKGHLPIVY